jgi:hypothetical protein
MAAFLAYSALKSLQNYYFHNYAKGLTLLSVSGYLLRPKADLPKIVDKLEVQTLEIT